MRGMSSMAKATTPASASALSAASLPNGSMMAIDEGAALVVLDLRVARPAHLEHDVGVAHRVLDGRGDGRAGGLVVGVEDAGGDARAGLHHDVGAERP